MSEIICGDCLEELKELERNSIDSVVTDPPYALAFMRKDWDSLKPKEYQGFSQEWGEQALRVLKPGAYLLAFSGTRTYHRMVVGLEDAGFEIKDQIDWLYGSGFPKSHDISKAIDKEKGKYEEGDELPSSRKTKGDLGFQMQKKTASNPQTQEAKKWDGWGTALKPAHEPIVLAQKPREGTYAENVLEHGVGGLNVDDSRIPSGSQHKRKCESVIGLTRVNKNVYGEDNRERNNSWDERGRWPANVILDPRSSEMLDGQSGVSKSTGGITREGHFKRTHGEFEGSSTAHEGGLGDEGGASRFFYCAKAHKSERNAGLEDLEDKTLTHMATSGGSSDTPSKGMERTKTKTKNDIATLKPINLVRYLVRLVTPPGGTVLDPFAGSGTTGCACEIEGFDYILVEKRERFANLIAPKRCEYWSKGENWDDLKEHEGLEDPMERKNANLEEFV